MGHGGLPLYALPLYGLPLSGGRTRGTRGMTQQCAATATSTGCKHNTKYKMNKELGKIEFTDFKSGN